MTLFDHPAFDDHEQVAFASDERAGLRAVIAIHRIGPRNAMGGTRMWDYATEADGIGDALRLSQAMTYKSALAGLLFGGGKAVIFGAPDRDKSPQLLRAMGSAVERLGGHFVTGEDVGISVDDVAVMRERTNHVLGGEGVDSDDPPPPGSSHPSRPLRGESGDQTTLTAGAWRSRAWARSAPSWSGCSPKPELTLWSPICARTRCARWSASSAPRPSPATKSWPSQLTSLPPAP